MTLSTFSLMTCLLSADKAFTSASFPTRRSSDLLFIVSLLILLQYACHFQRLTATISGAACDLGIKRSRRWPRPLDRVLGAIQRNSRLLSTESSTTVH